MAAALGKDFSGEDRFINIGLNFHVKIRRTDKTFLSGNFSPLYFQMVWTRIELKPSVTTSSVATTGSPKLLTTGSTGSKKRKKYLENLEKALSGVPTIQP